MYTRRIPFKRPLWCFFRYFPGFKNDYRWCKRLNHPLHQVIWWECSNLIPGCNNFCYIFFVAYLVNFYIQKKEGHKRHPLIFKANKNQITYKKGGLIIWKPKNSEKNCRLWKARFPILINRSSKGPGVEDSPRGQKIPPGSPLVLFRISVKHFAWATVRAIILCARLVPTARNPVLNSERWPN